METNELRIGNLFTDKCDNDSLDGTPSKNYNPINKVIAIQKDIVYFLDTSYETVECDDLEENGQIELIEVLPIPLTKKWMRKLGFKGKNGEYMIIEDDNMRLEIMFGFTKDGSVLVHFNDCDFKNCQYVHQLQNLYFALTGTELTTNTLKP
jgi:hypothetical protein